MVEAVCSEREIKDRGLILEMLLNRESLGSTAIGKGVAFPHGRTLAVRDLSIVYGRSVAGIDFDSVDKKPTHVFFLIIAPPQDFKAWQPVPPADPYPLGKYIWRD
jgi:PTS system nitrogen regulatory IIA component